MAGELVVVTGANGFIGSHCVRALLAASYTVRGTVRDANDAAKTAHLTALPGAASRLSLVAADLLGPDGTFDAAVAGATYVLHTACRYALDVSDPVAEVVDPAVRGTAAVLGSCARAAGPSLRRVVVTSSVAALSDHGEAGRVWTGADWNDTSSVASLPYHYAKTAAERTAHAYVRATRPPWDVVAINPYGVLGPSLVGQPVNQSVRGLINDMCNGGMHAIVDLSVGLVDVRDVADAHVAAMTRGTPHGRYVLTAAMVTAADIADHVASLGASRAAGFRLPRVHATAPLMSALVRAGAAVMPGDISTFLCKQLGNPVVVDGAPAAAALGLAYRPWRQTVAETVRDQGRWGNIPPLPPATDSCGGGGEARGAP